MASNNNNVDIGQFVRQRSNFQLEAGLNNKEAIPSERIEYSASITILPRTGSYRSAPYATIAGDFIRSPQYVSSFHANIRCPSQPNPL